MLNIVLVICIEFELNLVRVLCVLPSITYHRMQLQLASKCVGVCTSAQLSLYEHLLLGNIKPLLTL